MNYSQSIVVKSEFKCVYLTLLDISGDKIKLEPHRYRFEATVQRSTNIYDDTIPSGRVLDFEKIHNVLNAILPKDYYIYCSWSNKVDRDIADIFKKHDASILSLPDLVCAESICNYISQKLESLFIKLTEEDPEFVNVHLIHSVLREDNNNYVTWDPVASLV